MVPDEKSRNDKTWSFWQKEPGPFEHLVHKRWNTGSFHSKSHSLELDLGDYSYNMIRSLDFYDHAKKVIKHNERCNWSSEEVFSVDDNIVDTHENIYEGKFVYDSRVPDSFYSDEKSVKLLQHFLGWVIKVDKPIFDRENFTMMDYRSNKQEACSFTYVLPFDEHTALVEFTLFSPSLLGTEDYTMHLSQYIKNVLGQSEFEVIESEEGIIPMSDYDFAYGNTKTYNRIGTGGGWVKPSTGYSFKACGEYAQVLLDNLKKKGSLPKSVHRKRSRLFDSLFLSVLNEDNASGEQLFENMYRKLPAHIILKFLEEKTSRREDLRILSKFATGSFAKTLIKAQTGI